jgi:hypothetical protein
MTNTNLEDAYEYEGVIIKGSYSTPKYGTAPR